MVKAWLSPSEVNNSNEAMVLPLTSPKRTKRRPFSCRIVVFPSCTVTDRGSAFFSLGFFVLVFMRGLRRERNIHHGGAEARRKPLPRINADDRGSRRGGCFFY